MCAWSRRTLCLIGFCSVLWWSVAVAATESGQLRMYFVDVEGGQATLFVSPTGQSLLIDAGWPGYDGRDAKRIAEAAQAAGISRIDFMLVTHYHDDHVGGVPQLTQALKIGTFVDHGPNREDADNTRANYAAYEKAVDGTKRMVVKPGDRVPIGGMDVEVVSADGAVLASPLPGAGGANPLCAQEPPPSDDPTENAHSVGVLISYGKLRVLDLGDLTKKKELALVCPVNRLGTVDLLVVNHHGAAQSNSRALVHALHARVAIMDNGARKGASPDAWETVHTAPGLMDLWQLHYAVEGGPEHNVGADFIANREEKCQGKRLDVSADADGTITVTNQGNGFKKTHKR